MAFAFGGLGGSLSIGAVALFLLRRSFERRVVRTEGVVTDLDVRSSSEFPIVTFEAAAEILSGVGKQYTFRSNFSQGGYVIGQRVPVYYDPRNPNRATIMSQRASKLLALVVVLAGFLLMAIAAVLGVFVAPVVGRRDEAVLAFFDAYRNGDNVAVAALTAKNAQVDDTLLRSEAPKSRSWKQGNSVSGGGESCVRGMLMPNRVQVVLYLEEGKDGWKVVRAAENDARCEEDLD